MYWPCVYKITVFPSLWNIYPTMWDLVRLNMMGLSASLKSIYFSHFTYLPSHLYTHWFLYNIILSLWTYRYKGQGKQTSSSSSSILCQTACLTHWTAENHSLFSAVLVSHHFQACSSLSWVKRTQGPWGKAKDAGILEEKNKPGPLVVAC